MHYFLILLLYQTSNCLHFVSDLRWERPLLAILLKHMTAGTPSVLTNTSAFLSFLL